MGTSAHAVAEMTRENSVAIICGYPERGGEDAIFNSAQLFDAEGTPLANYRKTHLFGDLDNSMRARRRTCEVRRKQLLPVR